MVDGDGLGDLEEIDWLPASPAPFTCTDQP